MKVTRVWVDRSGYRVGRKQLRTVGELDAELQRRRPTAVHVLPSRDTPYRKVAAAVRVLQRRRIFAGFVGNILHKESGARRGSIGRATASDPVPRGSASRGVRRR